MNHVSLHIQCHECGSTSGPFVRNEGPVLCADCYALPTCSVCGYGYDEELGCACNAPPPGEAGGPPLVDDLGFVELRDPTVDDDLPENLPLVDDDAPRFIELRDPRIDAALDDARKLADDDGMHTVFVYGILKTPDVANDPPHAVAGTMYASGIAFCKFDDAHRDGIVRGQLRKIDDATLLEWDRIEGVDYREPERGMYRRIRITTECGTDAWVYEFNGSVSHCDLIADGVWLGYSRGGRW